jgi:hypothetical protein
MKVAESDSDPENAYNAVRGFDCEIRGGRRGADCALT